MHACTHACIHAYTHTHTHTHTHTCRGCKVRTCDYAPRTEDPIKTEIKTKLFKYYYLVFRAVWALRWRHLELPEFVPCVLNRWRHTPDLGRFQLRSRNQTTIPIPESESESESFVVHFGGVGIGVGIVVIGIGIGVGIVVIGIGVGIGIRWRFHTFMYMYHLTFIQEVTPRKLKALSHRVRNTARWKWLCLFRVDCCSVSISMYSIHCRHASLSCSTMALNSWTSTSAVYTAKRLWD